MATKEETEIGIFTKGDIISNLNKTDVRVILGIKNGEYIFINLKAQSTKLATGGYVDSEKGSEGSQPTDIVERHFSLLEI